MAKECHLRAREQLAIDLWKAVRDGQVDKVISLLKRGANPNYPPYFNQDWMLMHSGLGTWPPLHAACEAGNLSITKALVEGGADANKCSAFYTMTPLHRACIKGHKKVALYLIEEAKSKIDLVDNRKNTVLHLACQHNHKDIVEYLVEQLKMDVGVKNAMGRTPMASAVEESHKAYHCYCNCEVGFYLVNQGYASDQDKAKLLSFACGCGKIDIVKGLVGQHKVDPTDIAAVDIQGKNPLQAASYRGHQTILQYLLEELACDFGKDLSPVNFGIEGIYVQAEICDESLGYFSENKTVSTSCVDSTLYLFSRGFGDSATKFKLLCAACFHGRLDVVRQLMEQHNVELNVNDTSKRNTILSSAYRGSSKVVEYLYESHKMNLEGSNRRSPLDAVLTTIQLDLRKPTVQSLFEIALYLISKGYGDDQEKAKLLLLASYCGNLDIVAQMIEQLKVNPNIIVVRLGMLRTPLHAANREGKKDVVQYLVENCNCDFVSDPSPLDIVLEDLEQINTHQMNSSLYLLSRGFGSPENKVQLLYGACSLGELEVVTELVELHKVVELLGEEEQSPFERMTKPDTAQYHSESCVEIAAYLLKSGASVNDEELKTLLLQACRYGNLNAVRLVVENHQIDVNVAKHYPNTPPLIVACENGHSAIMRYLVEEAHCDVGVNDRDGCSPLEAALIWLYNFEGCNDAAICLINRGCGGDKQKAQLLYGACLWGRLDIVKELVELHNLNPNHVTSDLPLHEGRTPLEVAAQFKNYELVEYLNHVCRSQ